jgi:hypothetical protein
MSWRNQKTISEGGLLHTLGEPEGHEYSVLLYIGLSGVGH